MEERGVGGGALIFITSFLSFLPPPAPLLRSQRITTLSPAQLHQTQSATTKEGIQRATHTHTLASCVWLSLTSDLCLLHWLLVANAAPTHFNGAAPSVTSKERPSSTLSAQSQTMERCLPANQKEPSHGSNVRRRRENIHLPPRH